MKFTHHSAEPRIPRSIPNACHTIILTAMIAPIVPTSTITAASRFIVPPNVVVNGRLLAAGPFHLGLDCSPPESRKPRTSPAAGPLDDSGQLAPFQRTSIG